MTGYTVLEYKEGVYDKFLAYDENDSLVVSMNFEYDSAGNLIKGPILFMDWHYGGWQEVLEQYPNGKRKRNVQYDKDGNLIGYYDYDEEGNLIN